WATLSATACRIPQTGPTVLFLWTQLAPPGIPFRVHPGGRKTMRMLWVVVVAVMISIPGRGIAQGNIPPPILPPAVPPEAAALPGGTNVSRPLTPVDLPEIPPPADPAAPKPAPVSRVEEVQQQKYERSGPLGPGWDDMT